MVYASEYPIFQVTVDVVVFSIRDDELTVLLVRRGRKPYKGALALPGGFVDIKEGLLPAARRELREETGVEPALLEQLGTYGAPRRDPRGRIVSVAHLAVLPSAVVAQAGDDAADAMWLPVRETVGEAERRHRLAFDHRDILCDAVERLRSKLEYTTLATAFVGPEFTLSELRRVYEVAWGVELDPGNFQRKVRQTEGFAEETGRTRRALGGQGRPAATFRARGDGSRRLGQPVTRPTATRP